MTEKALLWNRFIEEICYQDIEELSEIQRMAVLCFWYDAEMNNGGYSGYRDCYPDTDAKELEKAILSVGSKELADNYHKAVTEGENDLGMKLIRLIMIFPLHYAITCKSMLKKIRQQSFIERV